MTGMQSVHMPKDRRKRQISVKSPGLRVLAPPVGRCGDVIGMVCNVGNVILRNLRLPQGIRVVMQEGTEQRLRLLLPNGAQPATSRFAVGAVGSSCPVYNFPNVVQKAAEGRQQGLFFDKITLLL